MFYNGIIFDLDNTLYNYDKCHSSALDNVITFIQKNTKFNDIYYIKNLYENISKNNKYELKNTASSHNKSIYFKKLLECLKLNYLLFSKINDIYWSTFYKCIECFEGVKEFIIWNKKIGKKIGVLTDYETEFQIIKLEKLELLEYIDIIITSEEVGIEKPSIHMFQTILRKMNLLASEVIMIGDSYEKDIQGAINMDILSYWFNISSSEHYCNKDKYIEFNNFVLLNTEFNQIYNELIKLKTISKYCGERFDLIQAGGGNTSIKIDDWMFIKASGYGLSNIDTNNGYVIINNNKVIQDISNNQVCDVIQYNIMGNKRGSIETFMHSILKKYTIHLHPIQVNRFLVCKNAREVCHSLYPVGLIIDYFTPGIKVCNEIKKLYNNENVIFLLNHGLIITSDTIDDIYIYLNDVLLAFENKIKDINFEKYKYTNLLSKQVNDIFKIDNITYLCEDNLINDYLVNKKELFNKNITFPDALVYCGIKSLYICDILNFELEILNYKKVYEESPKIIIIEKNIYISSNTLNKCKEIEDVLKSNLIILTSNKKKSYLSSEEICFLNNWDAEKFRKLT